MVFLQQSHVLHKNQRASVKTVGWKVQDKSEMRNTDGSGVLNKKGRFIAQNAAAFLRKKQLIY